MKKFIGVVALLVLTGFMAMPTLAAELQMIPNPNVYYVYAKTTFDSAASLR